MLAREEKGEQLLSLVFLGDPNPEKVGVGLVSFTNGKKEICLRKFYIDGLKSERICYTLDPSQKYMNIVEMGDNIIIVYEKSKVILDLKMKKLKDVKEKEMITFIDELNILKEPNGANLKSDEEGRTMLFFDFGHSNGPNNVQVFAKYMLVKKDDRIITNIPKEES